MQHCACDVMLSGDRNHVVRKQDVTVAEIEVLRAMHGDDAVANVKPTVQDKRKSVDELNRLRRLYRRRMPGPDDSGAKNIVDLIYPGPRPKLPSTLADIGEEHPTVNKSAGKGKTKAGSGSDEAKAVNGPAEPDNGSGEPDNSSGEAQNSLE